MKILIVRTFPDILNLNTYNVQEVGLAKALNIKGHQCDIVLYHGKNEDRKEPYLFNHAGKEYQFNIYWLKGFGILKNGFMFSLKKVIRDYDVIQVHEYDQIASWNLYTRQKKPTIIYHGPYYDEFAKGYNLKCRIFDMFFLPMRKISNVVAVTKSKLATEFLRGKGFDQVITAGVGINLDNFGEQAAEYQIQPVRGNEKNILYVGKIEERRNVYFLVDVFRKLHEKNSDIKLILIGNGEKKYKELFFKSIDRELEEGSIVYKEKASQKELITYYGKASFFILASNYEIFGMVLLEAMYFGVPVISSVNGGSTTLIENGYNGFVIEKFDKEQWVECMEQALQDDVRLEIMKSNAQKTIKNEYTWETLADKFIEAYELAIEGFGR